MDTNHGELLTRQVRWPADLVGYNQALEGPGRTLVRAGNLDRSARVHVLEGVLVEVMLGDHVKVLLQRTVGDEASSPLHAHDMPVVFSRISWVPRENL